MSVSPEALALFPAPELVERGRLRVELPHWAATVEVEDQDLRAVEDLEVEDGPDEATFLAVLRPGAYQLRVQLDGRSESRWVSVVEGRETRLPRAAFADLNVLSSVPAYDVADTRRLTAVAAQRASLKPPKAVAGGGPARMFLFLDARRGHARRRLRRLTLRSVAPGAADVPLSGGVVQASWGGLWIAVHLALPGGGYVLRDAGDAAAGEPPRNLALWFPEGWQAQVFLSDDQPTLLASLNYNLARPAQGFLPSSPSAVAAAAVLGALAKDGGVSVLSGRNLKLEELCAREDADPWLAVLAAHALSAADPAGGDPAAAGRPQLAAQVRQFLLTTLPEHPDVRALYDLSETPFDAPPMLRAGLRRLQQRALTSPGLLPVGGLSEQIGRRLVVDTPWTTWSDAAPEEAAPAREAVLQAALPTSAPVYAVGAGPSGGGEAGLIRDAGLATAGLQVLQARSADPTGPAPAQVALDEAALGQALDRLDPAELSRATGASPARAALEIETLRAVAAGDAAPVPGAADRLSAQALSEAIRGAAAASAPAAEGLAPRSLEDDAAELRRQAEAVRSAGAAELAAGLEDLARRLLAGADLVVVSDREERPLYANGAFQVAASGPQGRHAQPDFVVTSPTGRLLVEIKSSLGPGWREERTAVADKAGEVQGFVHLLTQEGVDPPSPEQLEAFREALPQVSLAAGLLRFGAPERQAQYRDQLQAAIERCRTALEASA